VLATEIALSGRDLEQFSKFRVRNPFHAVETPDVNFFVEICFHFTKLEMFAIELTNDATDIQETGIHN